jgi:UPF0755 protein
MMEISRIRLYRTLLFVVLLVVLGGGGTFFYLNSPAPAVKTQERLFKVIRGETVSAIAARLADEEVIRSALFLRVLSWLGGTETDFKSGYFRFMPGDTTLDVHHLLIEGYEEQVKITFPEGWTLTQVGRHLESKEICSLEEFSRAASGSSLPAQYGIAADTMEGYLFPDTYYFPKGYPAFAVAERMADNFFLKMKDIAPETADMDRDELHRKIILASIIEREYRLPAEARLIASVFYNRLRHNIGLESCATLQYIITEIEERPHPDYLTLKDKAIDSPYNTYKWAGLPPGPISSPGSVALDAAFHPEDTDFFYFVLRDPARGEHYFSEDLEEHNWAKYNYLKRTGTGG